VSSGFRRGRDPFSLRGRAGVGEGGGWGGGGDGSGNHLMRVTVRGELQFIHTDGSSVTGQVCRMVYTRQS
jgi:hypothetical protein